MEYKNFSVCGGLPIDKETSMLYIIDKQISVYNY